MTTQKQIAEHLDLNQSEVSRLMAELAIDWKTVPLDAIRVAYVRRLRAAASGHQSRDGSSDLVRERVLTEQVDRELKQYELAEKKGQLVSLEQLEPALLQMVAAFKTELIARDDKLKAELDALYGIDIDLQLLEDYTRDSLAQLARYDPERASADASDRDAPGAVAADVDDAVGEVAQAHVGQVDGQAGGLQP